MSNKDSFELIVQRFLSKDKIILDLSFQKLTEVPKAIARLSNLRILYLDGNQITEIPQSITQLTNLEALHLKSNQIQKIPKAIAQLKNLQVLDLSYNKIEKIPQVIANLKKLKSLYLSNNKIINIPREISELKDLEKLDLSSNRIKVISEAVKALSNLQVFNVANNKIRTIPEFICTMPRLQRILLDDYADSLAVHSSYPVLSNPIENPPPEIALRGLNAIRNYYKQLQAQGFDYLYAAKLLIVGEAGAGKTTLTHKIQDPNYSLDTTTTHGIDIYPWSFPYDIKNNFQASIWDFGGQEIYHATHQFFLTKRSLYILVTDERKEDTDFDYWLNIIELLAQDSPILVVQNERDGRTRKIDIRGLKGRFDNLKEIIPTDLKTGVNLQELIKHIQFQLKGLPHIGDLLPKVWVKIRKFLQNNSRNFVSLQLFLSLCKKAGFKTQKDCLQLSQYLHDLGVILHFQDDPLLKKTVILNPEWGTTAVYQILDNQKVKDNFGIFSRADLDDIWQNPEYQQMADELLQLMLKFKLCYQLPRQPNTFLAPELLNPEFPDYNWQSEANLIVRYEYEFMPKGILTTLIVEMNQWLKSQHLVWRSGIVLQDQNTEAEVIETYSKREIRIRVRGQYKRDLLITITHELDKIHHTFPGIKYKKLVPCNCPETCLNSPNPHFYDDRILKKFMADGQRIQCQKSYQMVDVRHLLDDVSILPSYRNLEVMPQQSISPRGQVNNFYGKVERADFIGNEKITETQPRISINADNMGVGINDGTIGGQTRIAGEFNVDGLENSEVMTILQTMHIDTQVFSRDIKNELNNDLDLIALELSNPNQEPNMDKIIRKLKRLIEVVIEADREEALKFLRSILDLTKQIDPSQLNMIKKFMFKSLSSKK